MKRITRMALSLMLLCVAGVVNASTEVVVHECDYSSKTDYPWYKMGTPTGSSYGVSDGTLVVENTVEQANNWDLQPFIDDNITAESGNDYIIRLTYKSSAAGSVTLNMGTWSASKSVDVALTVSDEFQTVDAALNEYSVGASNIHILLQMGKFIGTVTVQKVELVYLQPDDILFKPKQDLTKAIAAGELQDADYKTKDSYAALQKAISDGKAALEASDATVESLNAATKAINDAIDALELLDGYTKLTADMFMRWSTPDADATSTGSVGCAYVVGTATGQPYGDGSVGYLNYADLSAFDKMIIVATEGTPRVMMNRLVNEGAYSSDESASNLLEMPKTGDWTDRYYTKEDNVFTYNLALITKEKGFAHLNAIKGANWANVTVTGMYLVKGETAIKVKVGAAGYTTFCADKGVSFNGVEAFAAEYADGKVKLTPVTEAAAGTPVIIKAAADEYTLEEKEDAAEVKTNDLKVADGTVKGNGKIYVLADGAKGVGFYKLDDDIIIPNGKAYLEIAAGGREFICFGEATAIEAAKAEQADGAIYSLGGQRVKKAGKGVFIVGGKKVIK